MFSSQQRWLLFIVCWIVIFCQVSFSENLKNQPLRIYQIDVNTGDAALIVSPTNKYVLIDAGDDRYNYGDTVLRFLRTLGITHLDYLIVSHYHEDHIGGVPWVIYGLSGFGSNDSILNYCYDRGDTYTTSMYLNYVNAVGTKRRTVALGETLDLGGGVLMICVAKNGKVLSGDSVLPNSGENYRSLAWVLKYGLFKFFTGGDLVGYNVTGERDVETILAPVVRKVDVMKVNHHGSRNSSNNIFLDSLRPKAAVISQGTHPVNNNHPHQEAIDRLVAHNTYIYQMNDNPTGGTIPNGYGRILNTTATITVNQASFIINGDEYLLDGAVRDGACLAIIVPKDTIVAGTIINPKALIKNLGNMTESFRIRCRIDNAYNYTQIIYGLAPNDTITVTFDTAWYPISGCYQVICSTEVFGDTNCSNDKQTMTLVVAFYDSELAGILEPMPFSQFYLGDTLIPKAIVKDNSAYAYPCSVKIFCLIRNNNIIYFDSLERYSTPQTTDTIIFSPLVISGLEQGVYQCSMWVRRENDLVTTNDYQSVIFSILDPNSITEEKISPIINPHPGLIISMYDVSGRIVKTITTNNFRVSNIWFNNILPGVYFLQIDGKHTKKLIILPK
ncbi:MAG: MBL fold metallo-hydrolase [candidate division WOR-3 bacterium]